MNPVLARVAIDPVDCLKQGWQSIKDQYWMFFAVTLVGMIISNAVPFGILAGPMFCGIYLCWFSLERGETLVFENLFKGFDYFGESLIATLIVVGVVLVVLIPIYILMMFVIFFGTAAAGNTNDPRGFFVMMSFIVLLGVVLFFLTLLVGIFTIFIYPLIVDRDLKAVPAITTAFAAGRTNFGGLLGLALLSGLISLVALLLCYLPIFLVAPWTLASFGVAYRKVFPRPAAEE